MVSAVNACKRRAREEAACSSYMSLTQGDAGSSKGTAETWPLWPRSARGIVLGIRQLIAFFDSKEVKWENSVCVSKRLCLSF